MENVTGTADTFADIPTVDQNVSISSCSYYLTEGHTHG